MQLKDEFRSYLRLKPKDVGVKADIVHEQIHVALKHIYKTMILKAKNGWTIIHSFPITNSCMLHFNKSKSIKPEIESWFSYGKIKRGYMPCLPR